ncbi:hypothetical protein LOSG293_360020 [Secundilactobacillus oryzae JCM 18671]|uniref:Uncharacterized protein n=1 Tax=Secundilactobacillus oryzae JCM 18671 TaxID=1291743 RepID=A0A081BKG2_9LACO|nr:hypothetical protein [Secundilactobacillus oryzae]GAK48530.1 hypothetical protein LOSG293_360020 [Secundilactobacillus oryzae JCM 18671]
MGRWRFFATDQQAEARNWQAEFEAAAHLRYGTDYQYVGLDVKRRAAWRLPQGATKHGSFMSLPDGTIDIQNRRQVLQFVKWQIARNNLNKFSNADHAKRSQSVFANLNI